MIKGGLICKYGEGVWVSFCKISIFPSYPLDINRTAYIAGWQAHHHHQLCFLKELVYLVGEKDERGKALFANVERGVGMFL